MKVYDENNVFAKMLKGDIPVNKIYEDDYAIAFADIHPKAPVHLLVIPKGAYIDFSDFTAKAPAEEITGFFKAVGKVAEKQGLVENGYRLVMNTGRDGGQEVPHLHVHILAGKKLAF
ncbi:MAG: histidine triad nucleotide-binding protein [Alphaproteobacteria bacterium]|nr:histidine triad nucleotide-binding protein [Alphaproteobacteria bacterium]MBO4643634.1 histidine triad nucleotide-binding protein [Alphaproteobacteria bacterium]